MHKLSSVLSNALSGFQKHNGLNLAAALTFYTMVAMIPMILLVIFIMSYAVISSSDAIVQIAILVSDLMPKLSQDIMIEIYKVAQHKALWGGIGVLALIWTAAPLAGGLRLTLEYISGTIKRQNLLSRTLQDCLTILGLVLLLITFILSGLILEKILAFLQSPDLPLDFVRYFASPVLIIGTLVIFHRAVLPASIALRHILIGSFCTILLWKLVYFAYALFLSISLSYGSIFGGIMKNLFVSVGWLYYNFVAFVLGTELIVALQHHEEAPHS